MCAGWCLRREGPQKGEDKTPIGAFPLPPSQGRSFQNPGPSPSGFLNSRGSATPSRSGACLHALAPLTALRSRHLAHFIFKRFKKGNRCSPWSLNSSISITGCHDMGWHGSSLGNGADSLMGLISVQISAKRQLLEMHPWWLGRLKGKQAGGGNIMLQPILTAAAQWGCP